MHSFMTSFPEAERKGIFVLALEDDRLISNVEGEAANWELTLGQHAPQTPQIPIPIGTSGSTGTGGTSGTSGTTGTTGTSGTSGTSGTTGTTGTSGTSGTTGATGTSGTTGSTGTSGTSGSTGSTGTVGDDPAQCQLDNDALQVGTPPVPCGCPSEWYAPSYINSGFQTAEPTAGSDTGAFRRVKSKAGFAGLISQVSLPAKDDVRLHFYFFGGRKISDAAYLYASLDHKPENRTNSLSAEGGFWADTNGFGNSTDLWKPYLRWTTDQGSVMMQPASSGLRRIPPGIYTMDFRLNVPVRTVSLRYLRRGSALSLGFRVRPGWVYTPAITRTSRIVSIAQQNHVQPVLDLGRPSKICSARWSGTMLYESNVSGSSSVMRPLINIANNINNVAEATSNPSINRPSGEPYIRRWRQGGSDNPLQLQPWDFESVSICLGP